MSFDNLPPGIQPPPPVRPGPDETPVTGHLDFVAQCKTFVESSSKKPTIWGKQILTNSKKWGLIWRCDEWINKNRKNFPIRFVIWINDEGGFSVSVTVREQAPL